MTITALPTAPSRSDPANFPTRADAWITQFTNTTVGEINATATAINASQVAAAQSVTDAATQTGLSTTQANASAASAASASANAAAAAASAGAILWVSGTTYAIGDVRRAPANQRVYRRITAGAGTTDPSADPTNWTVINTGLVTVHVTTATFTTAPGTDSSVEFAGACAGTMYTTPNDGDECSITPANGRIDVTLDFGAKTVRGPGGSTTGILTLDLGLSVRLKYIASITTWVWL